MFFTTILTFLCSVLLSYVLYFPSLVLSYKTGAIDNPNSRKMHTLPTARAGGLAFFVTFCAILLVSPIKTDTKVPLVLSGTLIFLIGFLDDALSLSPFQKLSGQFLASSVYLFSSSAKSLPQSILTIAWLIFIVNATNLSDGLNGLASGICASESLCLAVLSLSLGNIEVFWCSVLLLGAILGFLPNNFPKAKIFMGDCGSLFLGFILAVLSSKLVFESKNPIVAISILLIFRIPTYDTNMSIIRRILKGKSPFKADKEHFHHQLIKHGFSKECTTLALVSAALFFGLLGIIVSVIK